MKRRRSSEGGGESNSVKKVKFIQVAEDHDDEDGDESEMDISAIEAMIPSQVQTQEVEEDNLKSKVVYVSLHSLVTECGIIFYML